MSVVIILINPQGLSEVAIAIVVSVIVYLFFILLLKGINQDEINFLKKMKFVIMYHKIEVFCQNIPRYTLINN